MRKFVLFILVFVFFSLVACSGGPDNAGDDVLMTGSGQTGNGTASSGSVDDSTSSDDETAQAGEDSQEQSDFALMVGNFLIVMNSDMTYTLEALGTPMAEFEEPSCAFDGIDRIFGYPDLQIHTYPVGDSDHIHTVMLLNDLIRTTEGNIRIRHSSLQDVIDFYGDGYVHEAGMYTFTRGLTTLEFYIENGVVEGITYGFIIV